MRKLLLLLILVVPALVFASHYKIIDTDVFSIEVPGDWSVKHEKQRQFLLAHSQDSYDGWPVQMLVIDYCKVGGPQKEKNTIQCNECSENTLVEFLKQSKTGDEKHSVIKTKQGDTTEYKVENYENNEAKISKLYCGENSQMFFMLMTSKKPAAEFLKILETVKLK